MSYDYLLTIAIILLSTKVFGLTSERVHMPQVVGALIAGVLVGPSVLNWVGETDFLVKAAELGVIILMFNAGMDTDLEELKKTGFASFIIAMIGVIVPLLGGMGCYLAFDNNPSDQMNMIKAAFIGVVLTATSVSITVETLREMGKLKSRVGTAILGAAVIDDILGIIVLTILSALTDPSVRPLFVLTRIVAFFVFVAVVGLIMYKAFLKMEQKWHKHRRIAIYAVAFALLMSYVAERFFGIADITGAYFAGIVLCSLADVRDYVASKTNVLGYMLFSPLFFASIGIKTNLEGLTVQMFGFAVALTIIAILTKIVGCGLGAKLMGFQAYDAFSIGLGMVSRGEVAEGRAGRPDRSAYVPADRSGRYRHHARHADPAQVRHEEANAGKHRVFRSGSRKYAQEQPFLKTSAKCYLKGPHTVWSFCLPTAGECAILNTVSPAARGSRKTSFLLEERPNE